MKFDLEAGGIENGVVRLNLKYPASEKMAQPILYWTDKIVYLFTKGLANYSYVMKGTKYCLLLPIILVVGCGQENTCELENLNEGEFVIKLYNTSGDLLLTKKGSA
jgi:hypothetical protein